METTNSWHVGPRGRSVYGPAGLVCDCRDRDSAKLVAAAPDMLAALQMVCDSGISLADEIEAAMLAAIAKAKP